MKWFKHDTDSLRNSKIRKVIRVHGVTGYAIWWAILERLYEVENGFQAQANELWLEDLSDDLKISDSRTLIRVLDTFASVNLISSQLWAEHIIYVDAITERGDRYIEKRVYEKEKKQKQRAKNKEVSNCPAGTGQGQGDKGAMSPSQKSEVRMQRSDLQSLKDLSELKIADFALAHQPNTPGIDSEEIQDAVEELTVSAVQSASIPVKANLAGQDQKLSAAAKNHQRFIEAYNAAKPAWFGSIKLINDARRRKIRELVKSCGGVDEAIAVVCAALKEAGSDPYWRDKKLSFENFMSNGKAIGLYERNLERLSTSAPSAIASKPLHWSSEWPEPSDADFDNAKFHKERIGLKWESPELLDWAAKAQEHGYTVQPEKGFLGGFPPECLAKLANDLKRS